MAEIEPNFKNRKGLKPICSESFILRIVMLGKEVFSFWMNVSLFKNQR